MRRRDLLAATAGLVGCRPQAALRPNILFVIADDQSWPHAGAYGGTAVRTPHFDRVASEGALFTRAYSVAPSCTPSRSAVLTGRHIWRVEEAGVLYGTMPPKYPLFTHLLEDSGYVTGFTGKGWSPGDWRAGGLERHPNGKEFNSRLHTQPVPDGIDKRDYAANFQDFLTSRPKAKPFCFWFGCTEPHRVYKKGLGLESGKKLEDATVPPYWPGTPEIRSDILDYYAEIEWFDTQLGRTLSALEKTGELDQTMVVVTSDNGMPFPRAKVNLYDPGVHMPLAIRWPGRFKAGRRVDDFVSHIDFAPTFLEAAGLTAPAGMDGRSLLGLDQPGPRRDCVYHAMERHTICRPGGATYPMRAIRTARYHYIRNFAPDRWPTGGPDFVSSNKTFHGDVDGCPTKDFFTMPSNQSKYSKHYELNFGKRPAEEFYDLENDPHELINLAAGGAAPDELSQHRQRLEAYLRQTGDPRIEGRDPWQDYVYHQTTGFGASFNRSLPDDMRRRAREGTPHKPE